MSSRLDLFKKAGVEGTTLFEAAILVAAIFGIGTVAYAGVKIGDAFSKETQTEKHFRALTTFLKSMPEIKEKDKFYVEERFSLLIENKYFIIGFDKDYTPLMPSECLGTGVLTDVGVFKPETCFDRACLCLYSHAPALIPIKDYELLHKTALDRDERKRLERLKENRNKGVIQCEVFSDIDTISSREIYEPGEYREGLLFKRGKYPPIQYNQNLGAKKQTEQSHAKLEYDYGYLVFSGGNNCNKGSWGPAVWMTKQLYMEKILQEGKTHLLIVPKSVPEIEEELEVRYARLRSLGK